MAHTPAPDFADYGLALPRLFVTAIAKPGGGVPSVSGLGSSIFENMRIERGNLIVKACNANVSNLSQNSS